MLIVAFGLTYYINIRHRLESQEGQVSNMNLVHLFTTFIDHNAPSKILHNHCFQFLLGITVVLIEIQDNGYTKFWGVNKVHYGLRENGE